MPTFLPAQSLLQSLVQPAGDIVDIRPYLSQRYENESMEAQAERLRRRFTQEALSRALGINNVIPLIRPK